MSAWDTESGLEEKYEGAVTDAYFDEGEWGPILKLTIDSPTLGQEVENWYGCGKGVKFVSDSEVDLAAMKGGMFNSASAVGQLIKALKGDDELLAMVGSDGPATAKSYIGINAMWESKEFSYKDRKTGEQRSYTRILPVAPAGGGAAVAEVESTDIPKWLVTLASKNDDYESFLAEALAHDDITADLRKVVLREEFWDFSS